MPSQVNRAGLAGSKALLVSASASGIVARSAPTYTGRGNCKHMGAIVPCCHTSSHFLVSHEQGMHIYSIPLTELGLNLKPEANTLSAMMWTQITGNMCKD